MKIIFDREEEKENFLISVVNSNLCPSDIGLNNSSECVRFSNRCPCNLCWRWCGLEMEVTNRHNR